MLLLSCFFRTATHDYPNRDPEGEIPTIFRGIDGFSGSNPQLIENNYNQVVIPLKHCVSIQTFANWACPIQCFSLIWDAYIMQRFCWEETNVKVKNCRVKSGHDMNP